MAGGSAVADTQAGVAVRGETLGLGTDLDLSLTDHLNARVGFAGCDVNGPSPTST